MKKIYNFFLRINTLNRAAFVMMLSVFFVGQVWGGEVTFSGENLNTGTGDKTVGCITLSSSDMTYSDGLTAGGGDKTFTLTATDATISQVVITTNSTNTRYKKENITSCTSCTRNGTVYTCAIDNAATVSCTNNSGGVKITQIDVSYTPTSDPAISTKTVCLNPDVSNWKQNNERYAVYCFGDGEEWYDMTLVSDGCGGKTYYKADVDPKYTTYIFCRMAGDKPENIWDNRWNQTNDLVKADGTYCTITSAGGGTTKAGCNWNHTPFEICISGPEYAFADDPLVLKATCPGATYFQWYKDGTAESNKIEGATSATYRKGNCVFEDAGTYYCKAGGNESAVRTSSGVSVKMFRMYFNVGRDGTDYGHVDLHNTDPDNHKAEGMIFLGENWDYAFSITDGFGHWYGNNNTNTTAMWSGNCTNWSMPLGDPQCWLRSDNGATYTFVLDYSNTSNLKISALYPPDNQTAGLMIYFDNNVVKWTKDSLHYRIGKLNSTTKTQMSLVPGTDNLFQYETQEYLDLNAWHIANNCGWSGDGDNRSIYRTVTGDEYAITKSVNYEGGATTRDITITPRDEHSPGDKDYNNNCEFYPYSTSPGMKRQNVEIAECTGGTVTVSYTDVDNTLQSFTSGNRDLAHTCILTITAKPDCGQKIVSLQVNGVDFTSGDTHILDADAVIEAVFADDPTAKYGITYYSDGGTINSGNVTEYTYLIGATLPTDVTKSGSWDFAGWYDNSSLSGDPVTEITPSDCGDKKFWAKWVPGKPQPEFTWDYASMVNAGGIYPISVISTGDANVTIEIVETITGVSGSFTAGNPATGTVTLGNYPAAETFTYRASSPATGTWGAKTETRTVTITRCVKSDNLAYGVGYIDAGSSSKPRYYHETTGVGRITKDFGGSGNGGDGGTWSGESWITKYNKTEGHLLQTYIKDVFKIVFYVKAGSSNVTISKLRIRDSYISSDSQGKNGLTGATVIYNGDPLKTSLDKNEQQTVEVTLAEPLAQNDFVYVKFSESSSLYGVKLYSAGGDEVTSLAFSGETEVEKYPGDAPFIKAAAQTTTPIPSGGSITYKSSDESVATVNPTTGEVTVLAPGRTTITAKLSAFGCFKEATATYTIISKNCGDPKCTVAVTTGSARKCASESVTLTATAAAGAAIQWYKDGAAIPGEISSTLTTKAAGEYYATATKVCLQVSNTIEVEDLAAPTAVALHDYYYIKAGRERPDIPLFKLTNVKIDPSSFTMSHTAPDGCSYELREDGIIYLVGTPSTTLAASTYSLTVTTVNDCGFANASATLELRTLEPTAKKQIAWIGCKGDGKNQQPLPGTLDGSQSTDHSLYKYLTGSITPSDPSDDWFVLTPVNAYCTIDPQKISDYYSQFDLILLTDYPDSHVCPTGDTDPSTGEKYKKTDANSYSNAIGCLIDEIPILTFEAFVAGLPNWGINTKPGPESPTEQTITLLCSAHNIFNNTFPVDEQIKFVTSSGMQGFAGLEAPPGMIYIATIPDGSGGTRITCCERQKVIEARMMMMGLNHNAMASVTNDGKTIIKQIIDYLLQFEEMADCALVFDNGENNNSYDETSYHAAGHTGTKGDGLWSTAANWHPAYNAVPKPFQAVRVDKPCNVDIENAHCSSIRLRKDGATYDGKLTIQPNGGLTVIDYIKEVHGTNYMTTYPSAASDLVIQASTTSQNGSLAFGNAEDALQATVEYYSLGTDATGANPVWQYMGIPITDGPMAIDQYHAAWMCSWESEGNVSSNWVWVENEDRIVPFKGYCITQQASKKYTHVGALCAPDKKELPLHYFTSEDGNGFNMFANSWVAPIDITKMRTEDFDGAEPTIYIYNTGTREQYDDGGLPSTDGTNTGAGQFNAVPVNAASYMSSALTKIPTMQGFFVQATREGTLTLDYDRICFNSTDYTTTAETMRAPRRATKEAMEEQIVPEVMRVDVSSARFGDRVYILSHPEFSEAFDLGWDGTKQEGDENVPMLAYVQGNRLLAVAAIETPEGQYLSFRAGEDSIYTFTFDYEGETIYLYDRLADEAAEIRTGNTYTFRATNKTAAERFLITATPPRTPTQVETVGAEPRSEKAEKIIHENKLMILYHGAVYDAQGARVRIGKEGAK